MFLAAAVSSMVPEIIGLRLWNNFRISPDSSVVLKPVRGLSQRSSSSVDVGVSSLISVKPKHMASGCFLLLPRVFPVFQCLMSGGRRVFPVYYTGLLMQFVPYCFQVKYSVVVVAAAVAAAGVPNEMAAHNSNLIRLSGLPSDVSVNV